MVGTELQIIHPQQTAIGEVADRLPEVHTNASNDYELLAVWLTSHADGSKHTLRAYERIARRFLDCLAATGATLRTAKLDNVQAGLESMRTRDDGGAASPATLQTYVAAVKSLLGFAHRVGFTRFNPAPLIRLKKAPRKLAEKLISEFDVQLIISHARPGRDQSMLRVAYYGALRVSEIVSLTWSAVIPRDNGEVQLAVVGKGDKGRNILLPPAVGAELLALRGDAPAAGRVFSITDRRSSHIVKAAAARAGLTRNVSPHTFRHAHASHALDNGASIALVSSTLGHADLKTTSVYSHAKPTDSSSRFLK